MLVKTKAIVISSLKFQEKSLIVKCFTLSDGLKSYFVRDAFSARKGNQKIAYFQPLTLIEIEAIHKNKGTLEQFKEIKINSPFQTIHSDVVKSTMTLFLSEMLHHSIHEEEKNEPLFHFIESALQWFDHHDEIANFHLIFLLEITKFLGFYPDISEIQFPFFEMKVPIRFRATGFDTTLIFKHDSSGQMFHFSLPFVPTTVTFDSEKWIISKSSVQLLTKAESKVVSPGGVSVYPNPFQDTLILANRGAGKANIQIFNSEGKKVAVQKLESGIEKKIILSGLPSGTYTVRFEEGGKQFTARLIKE